MSTSALDFFRVLVCRRSISSKKRQSCLVSEEEECGYLPYSDWWEIMMRVTMEGISVGLGCCVVD